MRYFATLAAALVLGLSACSGDSGAKSEMADCCKKAADLKGQMPKCCLTPTTSECCKTSKMDPSKKADCCKKADAGNPPACCKK